LERLRRFRLDKTAHDVDRVLGFLVRSAYSNIPAYRRLIDAAGTDAGAIRGVADLEVLPVVRREKLLLDTPLHDRIHQHALPSRCWRGQTSGSQGIPADIYMASSEALFRKLLLVRAWRRGNDLPLPFTVIDVATSILPQADIELRWHGPVRVVRVPIARMDEVNLSRLERFRGAVLSGFPSSLGLLADRLWEQSSRLSIRLVVTRGEILCSDVRSLLERAFRAPVMDFYNCEEAGNMARQCPEDPQILHINTDGCLVEVVDEAGHPVPEGVEGKVLVTCLYNCTMPIIRYDLQDRAIALPYDGERCTCGTRSPSIGLVQGREDDILSLPGGHRVSPRLMATTLERAIRSQGAVAQAGSLYRQYQIVQDGRDHLTVRIIPISGVSPCFEKPIAEAFREIDPDLRTSLSVVDHLPSEPSGKFRKVLRSVEESDL